MTATGAAGPFEQVAPAPPRLRETGCYDPRLVDMLIARLRTARPNHRDFLGTLRSKEGGAKLALMAKSVRAAHDDYFVRLQPLERTGNARPLFTVSYMLI